MRKVSEVMPRKACIRSNFFASAGNGIRIIHFRLDNPGKRCYHVSVPYFLYLAPIGVVLEKMIVVTERWLSGFGPSFRSGGIKGHRGMG